MIKILLCSLFGLLLLPSCGLFKKKPKPVEMNRNIRLAGRVYKVDQQARFVLIRRYGPWRTDESDVVESRGEGRTANLLPTGERLGEHVAADIRSGNVEVGDGVYVRKINKPEKPDSEKPSANSEKPVDADNQEESPKTP